MQKVVNRFWEWLFHPGVRGRTWRDHKGFIYRYPAPGNNNAPNQAFKAEQDFKTPYTNSKYNVRYSNATATQLDIHQELYIGGNGLTDPLAKFEYLYLRLRGLGFLKAGDEGDAAKVAQAKKSFETAYKQPLQSNLLYFQPGYKDGTSHFSFSSVDPTSRESISNAIQAQYKYLAAQKKSGLHIEFDTHPQYPIQVPLESLDLYTLPHFQQSRLENEYAIEKIQEDNIARGGFKVMKGEERFWKALDDSNDPKDVKAVQQTIGKGQDANNFELRDANIKIITDKDGKVIDIQSQLNR